MCAIARTSISMPPCVWTVAGGGILFPQEMGAMGERNEPPRLPSSLTLFAGSLACAHVHLNPPAPPMQAPGRPGKAPQLGFLGGEDSLLSSLFHQETIHPGVLLKAKALVS